MTYSTIDALQEEQKTNHLTIADGLFILVGIGAAVMRLTELSKLPLSGAEAHEALAVWQFWQPGTADLALSSPAYFTFTAMLTPILGISDGMMRLVPALFGILLVLLPWLLRDRLSTVGALVTAVFLTVSPIAVALSRTAGGDSIALFAAFLLLIAWVNGRDSGNGRWFYLFTIALALGFTSSPLFYSALATLGVAWLGQKFAGPHLFVKNEEDEAHDELGSETLRNGIITGSILFLLISTFYLLSVGNVGASAAIAGDWFTQFGGFGTFSNAVTPFLAIVRYEIALLVVGLVAIMWAAWRSQSLPMFSVYWLLGILLLVVVQQGVLLNAALVTLPLYLLIGAFSGAIIGERINWHGWLLTGGLLIIWALMFVNFSRFLRKMTFGGTDLGNAWIIFFALAFALTLIFFAISWDSRATYQAVLLSVLLMLLFYNWGTAWWLSHEAANNPLENWVREGTHDSMLVLADMVQDLSWQLSKSDRDVDILSTVDTPVMRWYLREYVNAEIGKSAPPDTTATLVITPANAQTSLGTTYMGADYAITQSEPLEKVLSTSPTLDTLRWWIFHQSNDTPAQERVILWVKMEPTP